MRAERRLRRWTLEQFGRLIGVDASMVSLIETGKRGITPELRAAIVRELKLPEEYLFPEIEQPAPSSPERAA